MQRRTTVHAFLIIVTAMLFFAATVCMANPADDLERGRELVKKGDCSGAIPVLSKVVDTDPALAPHALHAMADCYKEQKKWAEAISCYSKLLTEYSGSVVADREIKTWIMDCRLANNEPDKALSLRKDLLNDYGQDAWKLYYIMGRRYVWQHKHAQAIPEFEKAVELGRAGKDAPELLDAKSRLLACYLEDKRWDKAEALAQRLMEECADKAYRWYYAVGKCQQGRRDYQTAIESLEKAAELVPKNAFDGKDIFKALFASYLATRRWDEAIVLGERLVKDQPQEPAWQWELAQIHLQTKEYAKAVPLLKRVINSSKRRWEIRSSHIYLGECLSKMGRGQEALQDIEAYYRDKPELWDEALLVKAAVLLHGPKDSEGCVMTLQELVAADSAGKRSALIPTARELIYQALENLEDWAAAASILEQMAAGSRDPVLLCHAGQNYFHAGKYGEARRVYKALLARSDVPDSVRASSMHGLALCYWDIGLKNSARRMIQRVLDEYPATEGAMKAQGTLYLWSQHK